jgi:hypothetical protein
MMRRPLWNRGGGVFVEEAAWSVPVERRPAADLPADGGAAPAPAVAAPADRPPKPARPTRPRDGKADPRGRRDDLRPRPTWLGILTVRED